MNKILLLVLISLSSIKNGIDINAKDDNGRTALMEASKMDILR